MRLQRNQGAGALAMSNCACAKKILGALAWPRLEARSADQAMISRFRFT
jgi:hypothetical protein